MLAIRGSYRLCLALLLKTASSVVLSEGPQVQVETGEILDLICLITDSVSALKSTFKLRET